MSYPSNSFVYPYSLSPAQLNRRRQTLWEQYTSVFQESVHKLAVMICEKIADHLSKYVYLDGGRTLFSFQLPVDRFFPHDAEEHIVAQHIQEELVSLCGMKTSCFLIGDCINVSCYCEGLSPTGTNAELSDYFQSLSRESARRQKLFQDSIATIADDLISQIKNKLNLIPVKCYDHYCRFNDDTLIVPMGGVLVWSNNLKSPSENTIPFEPFRLDDQLFSYYSLGCNNMSRIAEIANQQLSNGAKLDCHEHSYGISFFSDQLGRVVNVSYLYFYDSTQKR